MSTHNFSKEIVKETKAAIKEFGRYTFTDKGPTEIMDLSPLSDKFKQLTQAEKVQVAKDLKKDSDATAVLLELIGSANLTDAQISEIAKVGGEEIADFYDVPTGGVSLPVMSADDLIKKLKL